MNKSFSMLIALLAAIALMGCGGPQVVMRTNAVDGKKIVRVPAGEFRMGTSAQQATELQAAIHVQAGAWSDEPDEPVSLGEFYIDQTPVTNAEYKKFLDTHPNQPVPFLDNPVAQAANWDRNTRNFSLGRDQYPVVLITWNAASAYCQWAGGRLPTEAEWEKAARGTDGRAWPWGNTWDPSKLNSAESKQQDATPVGQFPAGASPYGALDMAGNVWQWTSSLDKPLPYRGDDRREDPNASGYRITRGGAWLFGAAFTRTAMRNRFAPDQVSLSIGFRCAFSTSNSHGEMAVAPRERPFLGSLAHGQDV